MTGRHLRVVLLAVVLAGVGIAAGFLAALAVAAVGNVLLPPFRLEDDDTLREYGPVALSYATWVLVTVAVFGLGWRRLRRTGPGDH